MRNNQRMRRPTLALAVPLAVALLLGGCSDDEIREQAESLASEGGRSVSAAAVDVVRDQICQVVDDARVSTSDITVLRGLVDSAEAAGVDEEVLGPVREIVEAGETAPADAVSRLDEACGPPA